jgi:rhodanese-related sulfurtransferase
MGTTTHAATRTITRDELRVRLENREAFTLVETLARDSFEKGHIAGAINLPPDQVQELAPTLLPDKAADIVVYCGGPT